MPFKIFHFHIFRVLGFWGFELFITKSFICTFDRSSLCSFTVSIGGANNLHEVWLERSSTNQEAINVRLGNQIGSICSLDWSTILDTDALSNFLGNIGAQPTSDKPMGLLSLCWTCSDSCSNCPDRLISYHHSIPVGDWVFECSELGGEELIGQSFGSGVQMFTNTHDRI